MASVRASSAVLGKSASVSRVHSLAAPPRVDGLLTYWLGPLRVVPIEEPVHLRVLCAAGALLCHRGQPATQRPLSRAPSRACEHLGGVFAPMAQPSMRDFEVLGELGSGSYARVLHVRRTRDGQAFALKVMNKAFLVRNNKAEGARRERELLERLGGRPGVVGLHFAFQDASHLYLALDVCPGGDLQQQLARRPGGQATRQEARLWAAQLVLALAAVHAAGAVHRDVKPENVLLTADGYVRLCDFGSAKRLGSEDAVQAQPGIIRSRCGTFAGTAEYCAPELIQGKLAACVASDFWSLGCVIFHMLVCERPSAGCTTHSQLTGTACMCRRAGRRSRARQST